MSKSSHVDRLCKRKKFTYYYQAKTNPSTVVKYFLLNCVPGGAEGSVLDDPEGVAVVARADVEGEGGAVGGVVGVGHREALHDVADGLVLLRVGEKSHGSCKVRMRVLARYKFSSYGILLVSVNYVCTANSLQYT